MGKVGRCLGPRDAFLFAQHWARDWRFVVKFFLTRLHARGCVSRQDGHPTHARVHCVRHELQDPLPWTLSFVQDMPVCARPGAAYGIMDPVARRRAGEHSSTSLASNASRAIRMHGQRRSIGVVLIGYSVQVDPQSCEALTATMRSITCMDPTT